MYCECLFIVKLVVLFYLQFAFEVIKITDLPLTRANFLGTSFTVFDSGVNPQKIRASGRGFNIREELAAVHYVSLNSLLVQSV